MSRPQPVAPMEGNQPLNALGVSGPAKATLLMEVSVTRYSGKFMRSRFAVESGLEFLALGLDMVAPFPVGFEGPTPMLQRIQRTFLTEVGFRVSGVGRLNRHKGNGMAAVFRRLLKLRHRSSRARNTQIKTPAGSDWQHSCGTAATAAAAAAAAVACRAGRKCRRGTIRRRRGCNHAADV